MVVKFNRDGKGEKYKMAFRKEFVELPLRVFVDLPTFRNYPADIRRLCLMLATSDAGYVIRISPTRLEIGYKSDEWHELK